MDSVLTDRLQSLKRDRRLLATIVANDIPEGFYVNLGIGMPTGVLEVLSPEREVVLHSENGVIGVGPRPRVGEEDFELIDAGKSPITLVRGGAFVNHCDSFALIRGGHLDLTILGAFQVSECGDLANWHVPGQTIPSVGGAMDLAVGSKAVWVMTDLLNRDGSAKLVKECTLPLTAKEVVRRIYTDLATFDVIDRRLSLRDIVPGLSIGELQGLLDVEIITNDSL